MFVYELTGNAERMGTVYVASEWLLTKYINDS